MTAGTVGIIGVGKIGLPICRNLLASGFSVVGYRRSSLEPLMRLGGAAAASPAEVAARSDVVLTCVDSDEAMASVVSGSDGLAGAVREGQIVVCLSSHPVVVKQAFADALAAHGAVMLDGEVSGTPGMVEARKAAIYLAGPADAAESVTPVVRGFADVCLYLGAFGCASRVKLVNNFLVALHIAGTAQAMAIGRAWGIAPDLMISAVTQGSGASTQFAIRAPWMAERRFSPQQGATKVLLHYLETIRDATAGNEVATDMIDQLIDLYARAVPVARDRDVAALIELFEPPLHPRTGDAP